jgi:hypothetical protein
LNNQIYLRITVLLMLVVGLGGCDGSSAQPFASAGDQPPAAKVEAGRVPVGLFFMTRYWSGGSLEKSAWYFAPDGTVYENIATGFSADDLAAHKNRKGKATVSGKKMDVTWGDGKTTSSDFEPEKGSFAWDMGIFTAVTGFKDQKEIIGKYEGGETLSKDGNFAASSKTLELRPDGTYTWEGVASFVVKDDQSKASASSSGTTSGQWELKDYSLTLTDDKGNQIRRICFPFDVDEKAAVHPSHIFFGGMLMKRQ